MVIHPFSMESIPFLVYPRYIFLQMRVIFIKFTLPLLYVRDDSENRPDILVSQSQFVATLEQI
jgi:hypothetical protein